MKSRVLPCTNHIFSLDYWFSMHILFSYAESLKLNVGSLNYMPPRECKISNLKTVVGSESYGYY